MGWFPVIASDELRCGEIQPARYFGEELVLWRDVGQTPHVMGAYCPHLGAHLGYGGTVDGNSIQCPFHGWRFAGNGQCVEIPYSSRPHPRARLQTFVCDEKNGQVIAWYHPAGDEPQWSIPAAPEWEAGDHLMAKRTQRVIPTSWQELSENGIDFAHFPVVHKTHKVESFEMTSRGPVREVARRQKVQTPGGWVDAVIESQEFGPGLGIVRFSVEFEHIDVTRFFIVTGATPIDERSICVRFSLFVQKSDEMRRSRAVGQLLLRDLMRQLDQDIIIWEHKKYIDAPLLVRGDGPIRDHRVWASQFYVSN
jgi:nitrite reductase/ring-hydroxylating ferredoxin subunit